MLAALVLAAAAHADALDRLAAAFAAGPAWRAAFAQEYLPAGFDQGTSEAGTIVVAPPASLRFDYTSGAPRVFASDGAVGRLVDVGAGSCDALRLDAGVWARLPLSAVLDPAAARAAFAVTTTAHAVDLVPRHPTPELARVSVTLGSGDLPDGVTITDGSGNRNRFTFTGWHREASPPPTFFRPSLPGAAPCQPEE